MPTPENSFHSFFSRAQGAAGELRRATLCVLIIALFSAPPALAANRIYWSNYDANSISYANLDGSGGGMLPIGAAPINGPMGLSIDPAAGRIYWANWGAGPLGTGRTISYANLDGSGGGSLPIDPAFVHGPHGVAIDPASHKIYWPNAATNTISYANVDGSGAGNLATGGATLVEPRGVAVDPPSGRIYWANWSANKISYANLNGSGGRDLATGAATVDHPEGVAIDPVAGRIYWSAYQSSANTISYANLDGTRGADLNTNPVAPRGPHGVAIDPGARRIYWPNYATNTIAYASLNGGGGAILPAPNATVVGPDQPALLEVPAASGTPAIRGGSAPRSTLHCRAGWAGDEFSSLLYRAPQSVSYQWIRGNPIAGQTSTRLPRARFGDYQCRTSARNAAGEAIQLSPLFAIFKVGKPRLNRRKGTAVLPVTVPSRGTVSLLGRRIVKVRRQGMERSLATAARKVHRGKVKLPIKLKARARSQLIRRGKEKVKVVVVYRPRGGSRERQARKVTLVHR